MKSMRAFQPGTLRQLFETRPALRRALHQLQHPPQQSFRTRPSSKLTRPIARSIHTKRPQAHASPFAQAFKRRAPPTGRRFNSSSSNNTSAPAEKLSLSQRLKKLSREYGWAALGVYLALTALDFPFCFLAVRLMGTERIGHYEHVILSYIKGVVKWPLPQSAQDQIEGVGDVVKEKMGLEEGQGKRILEESSEAYIVEDHGYKQAEAANRGADASIWTQLALAYAIHKSFIFIRVPLTAAVTPKVVKTLRSWGWNIGKMPNKQGAAAGTSGTAGINTKGSKVRPDD